MTTFEPLPIAEPEYLIEVPDHNPIPHSREAEEAIVGGVMINPDTYIELSAFLRPDDFFIHRLRFIWEAYGRLSTRQIPIDCLTLSEELDKVGKLREVGGPAYLTALLNQCPTTLHAEAYGQIVKATAVRRKLITAAGEIATLAYNRDEEIENVISGAEQAIFQVTDKMLRKGDVSAHDGATMLYDHVDELHRNGTPPGILTGLKDFDGLTGGLVPGTSLLVAARPRIGKTSLLLTWLAFIESRANAPAIVFNSMEMTPKRLMGRIAAIISGVSAERIKNGTLDDEDWPRFNWAIETIGDWPLTIKDERDPLALFPMIKHMHQHGECDLLMNDYIGKFEAKAESRLRQVAIASATMSKIAVKVEIPVATAAQVSRTIDMRGKDSELVLSDLKETGDLEQDADQVLFLNQSTEPTMQNIRNCHLAKNRDGAEGRFELLFQGYLTKFENVTLRRVDIDNYRDISEKD